MFTIIFSLTLTPESRVLMNIQNIIMLFFNFHNLWVDQKSQTERQQFSWHVPVTSVIELLWWNMLSRASA